MLLYFFVASIFTCFGFLISALAHAAKINALQAEIDLLRSRNTAMAEQGQPADLAA